MALFWITLVLTLIGSNAEGELCVFHSPDSLSFVPTVGTPESLLKDIFSAALGLSVEPNSEWRGMFVMNPFSTPEAVVEVAIDGVSSLGENAGSKTKIFPLIVDEYEPDTFKGMTIRIMQRFDSGSNKIVHIKLSDENHVKIIRNVFGKVDIKSSKRNPTLKLIYLNRAVEEDRLFLSELGILKAIIEKVQRGALKPDNIIDFYHLRFRTLHALSDFYGPHSLQTTEALKLLGDALQELNKAFVKAYDGSVLVTVVTTDVAHTRRSARSLTNPSSHLQKWPYEWLEPPLDWQEFSFKPKETPTGRRAANPQDGYAEVITTTTTTTTTTEGAPTKEQIARTGSGEGQSDINTRTQAKDTKENHVKPNDNAPIFNIFLGVGMMMWFSILSIIYFCMDMDPGRDTIIYRMTTMRTKKDL